MAKSTSVKKTKTPAKTTAVKADVVATVKKSVRPTKNKEIISPKMIFNIWLDGWKKTFNIKGRSSRFELWIFMLINSILTTIIHIGCYYISTPNYLRAAYAKGYSIEDIETHIAIADITFYVVMIVALLPLLSMLIRRIHDIGFLLGKNYLEHTSMSMVTMWLLFLASLYMEEMKYTEGLSGFLAFVALVLYSCFIFSVYTTAYHCLKFLIITLFSNGTEEANAHGKASAYNTPYYENIALSLSCIYLLFISTMTLIYLALFIV